MQQRPAVRKSKLAQRDHAISAAPQFGKAKFGEQVQDAATVFAPNDFFGARADGSAWVARGKENRVDWRSSAGTWSLGTSREFQAQPVTQADRELQDSVNRFHVDGAPTVTHLIQRR